MRQSQGGRSELYRWKLTPHENAAAHDDSTTSFDDFDRGLMNSTAASRCTMSNVACA